ncbi:hypothetical protein BIW11_09897, partial [Tropilaelaps mercedesae]
YRSGEPCLIGDRRDNDREVALCSRSARYCKAEVARQLGLLVTFQRSCAEECAHSCSTKGFGIVKETCTYCCTSDPSCSENPETRRRNYARPNYTRPWWVTRRSQANLAKGAALSSATRMTHNRTGLGNFGGPITSALLAAIESLVLRYCHLRSLVAHLIT